jgi:hypothetical protein
MNTSALQTEEASVRENAVESQNSTLNHTLNATK